MSTRKPVTLEIYAKWGRLKKEVEQCVFDACESNEARGKRRLGAALNELNAMTVAVHEFRKRTDPQFIKELTCQIVRKIRRGGDKRAAHRVVTELLVQLARYDFDERERLRELGVTVRRSWRFQRYADPRVVGALVDAVVASTRIHPPLGKEEKRQRDAARLERARARARSQGKSDAECPKKLPAKRQTKSGTSVPDEHVFAAAWLVRATTADNAATYQSQVRAARQR